MNRQSKTGLSNKAVVFILMIIIAVVPLIVKLYRAPVTSYEMGLLVNTAEYCFDWFSYYKASVLNLLSGIIVLIFLLDLLELLTSKNKAVSLRNPAFILTGIYVVFLIISSIFSPYKELVLSGALERYESVWVLLSYMAVFLAAYLYVNERSYFKYMIYALFASMLIIGVIGFSQFIGNDFFTTPLGNKLVLGKEYSGGAHLDAVFNLVYATLYNPNCVGLYTSMMIPFCLVMFALMPLKSGFKYVSLWFSVLMFINLIGSGSAAGLIGAAFSIFFLLAIGLIYFISTKKYKHITRTVLISAAMIFVFTACFIFFNDFIRNRILETSASIMSAEEKETPYFFKNVDVRGYEADIYTMLGKLTLVYDKNSDSVFFRTEDGTEIMPISTGSDGKNDGGVVYNFAVEGFGNIAAQKSGRMLGVKIQDVFFMFGIDEHSLNGLDKNYEIFDIHEIAPSIGFKGREGFATGRGYIWSRSIPLALDSTLIGSGPDTFVVRFPQNDIIMKTRVFGNPYVSVDKPHNFYLQTAIQTGMISMLCLVLLFLLYIVQTVILILKTSKHSYKLTIQTAFLGAVTGYLVTALATDSAVSVAPVFWIMLGMGFAANRLAD